MVGKTPEPETIRQLKSPACRVICDTETGRIKSVAVWWPDHGYSVVRPKGSELGAIGWKFAGQVANEIAAGIWPRDGARTSLPTKGAALLSIVQDLLDPRIFASRVVGVMAQIAALKVGFPLKIARLIGELAGNLAGRLLGADRDGPGMRALQYADVTFSEAGKLIEYLPEPDDEVPSRDEVASPVRKVDRDQPAGRGRPPRGERGRARRVRQVSGRSPRDARDTAPGRVDAAKTRPSGRQPPILPGAGRGTSASRAIPPEGRSRWPRQMPRPGDPTDRSDRGGREKPPSRG
jgi:hypothetical protein